MLKKILIAAALAVVALVILVAKQPGEFNVSKSIAIDSVPSEIFANINDLHKWKSWSPWAKLDANMKTTFSGSESGVGSVTTWSGNKEVGEGSMKIVESVLNESIKIELTMLKPYAANNIAEFSLKKINDKQTIVTWSVTGKKSFTAKAIGMVMHSDEIVDKRFEEGLNNLRKFVEENAAKSAAVEVSTDDVKVDEEAKK